MAVRKKSKTRVVKIPPIIARWFRRLEFINRIQNIPRANIGIALQLAIFIKLFAVSEKYVWIGIAVIILLLLLSAYFVDKTNLQIIVEGESGRHSEAWIELNKKVDKILELIDDQNLGKRQ